MRLDTEGVQTEAGGTLEQPGAAELERASVAPIVRQLASWRRSDREAAEARVRAMGPDAVGPLLEAWQVVEGGRWPRQMLIGLVGTIVLGLSAGILFGSAHGWRMVLRMELVGGAMQLAAAYLATSRLQRRIIGALAGSEDLAVVRPLSRAAVSFPTKRTRCAAAATLVRLLHRVESADAWPIGRDERKALYAMLGGWDPALAEGMLAVISRIPELSALPHVERLARRTARRPRDARLHAAAMGCLTVLRDLDARERAPVILLRPADRPGIPSQGLLRPAAGPLEVDEQVLLRPADRGADGGST